MPRIRPLSAALASCLLIGCSTAALSPPGRVIPVGAVQGQGSRSPHEGQVVVVQGPVTAIMSADGWYVQDGGDGDDATSDALFVQSREAVGPGDLVRVQGTVAEVTVGRSTRTTLLNARVQRIGTALLPSVVIQDAPLDWERLEGMSVRVGTPLVLIDNNNPDRNDQSHAALGQRLWQPTERAAPASEAARAIAEDNAHRTVVLRAAAWPSGLAEARAGSHLEGASGIIDEGEEGITLHLNGGATLQPASRPAPPVVAGNLRVAALNLENLFNGDGHGGGFPTPRGARSPAELAAQLAKHVATLCGLDADVVALMELENDGYGPESSLASLVSALNADGGDWRAVNAGQGPGDNPIRVGLIYRAGRVRPQGKPATLEGGPFGPHSRVPMAQAFVPLQRGRASGPAFVVAANHFKSKGCSGAEGADRDQHDGAACWNATRTESARRLDVWLKSDPTKSGSDLAIIVGDLNAYAQESPVRTLADAGWRDAFAVAGVASPYSYVYDGRIGRLDHALLSPSLSARLRGAAEWHSNADEPETSGYRDGGAGPWRSSDHDPLLLGFDMHR